MSDSDVFNLDDEVTEPKILIACECYGHPDDVRDALSGLPDFGKLDWGAPCTPAPFKLIDAELVLILSDKASLLMAIGRSVLYQRAGRAHVLIYLQDETEDVPAEVIPALVLLRSQLAAGLLNLTQIILEPVITPGFVGIDWGDVRNILNMGGQVVMERASSTGQPEEAIKRAVSQLQARTAGCAIHGLQAAIISNGKMPMKSISDLSWACRDNLRFPDKDSVGYDTYFIVAAPLLDWLDDDYEVRLFAKIECTNVHWPSDLILDFSDGLGA
ncbi:MAG: hypothetical protein WA135_14850 [Thiobacillus sp.]